AQRATPFSTWSGPCHAYHLNMCRLEAQRQARQASIIATDSALLLVRAEDLFPEAWSTDTTQDRDDGLDRLTREADGLTDRIVQGRRPERIQELLGEFLPKRGALPERPPEVRGHGTHRVVRDQGPFGR